MKRRILVVDDESIVAQDISECLMHMGCDVVGHALSGPDAIAKAGKLKPDLIMMDIVLQGQMDGVEAATVIRQRYDIPCVFLTAYSDGAVLARAKAAAPAGYMVKPYEEAGLRSTVEIALYKVDLEKALRESREWFLTTLMSIADGVIATDHDGRIRFLNPPAEKLTGWASQDAEGRPVEEVFTVSDEARHQPSRNLLREALAGGKPITREKGAAVRSRDGRFTPIADSAAPIHNREGDLAGAVIIFRDITERRRSERTMEEENEQLEGLVRERTVELRKANEQLAARVEMERMLSALSASFLAVKHEETDAGLAAAVGIAGSYFKAARCYFMRLNAGSDTLDTAAEWCAADVPPLAGAFQSLSASVLPPEFQDTANHTSGVVAFLPADGRPGLNQEFATARKSGSLLWLRAGEGEESHGYLCLDSIPRRDWTAEDLRGLGMAAGIFATALRRLKAESDKARLQSQLQQSMKMEAVGKLSGGIAHDFNNMLLPIIGSADMILMRISADDPSVTELREIKRSAERASALTRQLLAFSRKQVAKKTVFDLNTNLEIMTRMLGRIIGENIRLHMELSPDPVPLRADQGQIEQIIMNLVINARDAMPSGGDIAVRTLMVDAAEHPVPVIGGTARTGRYAVLAVSDNGCGIPDAIKEKIFEPFFSTKGQEGTGLGLSVVFGILQDHQGGIQLHSAPGQGTTFYIFLPAAPTSALVAENARTTESPAGGRKFRGRGERVLLVEDEEAVSRLVRNALTQNGYSVTSAATVREAEQRFDESSGEFEMIFSDAVLPDGNGIQLLDAFLTRNPRLRALLSSGYTDKNGLLEMARHRRISFLPKPYSLPDLFKTVAEVMEDQNTHLLE